MKSRLLWAIPLVVLAALVVLFARGLKLNPREVPSPLIGKPAPEFTLPRLDDINARVSPESMRGKVWLLNVWASWCVGCRDEHPTLVSFAREGLVPVFGLNYKDEPDAARAWLARFGDPYAASIVDREGVTGIDYGVYGVPETFVIDAKGLIRAKRIGPLTPEYVAQELKPLVATLLAESGKP